MNLKANTGTLAFGVISILLSVGAAQALTDCTNGHTITGNSIVKLTDNYESNGGSTPCIYVAGAGVDLDGYTITCKASTTCHTAAIQLTSFAGSSTTGTAKNGKASISGGITGSFDYGVQTVDSARRGVVTNLAINVSGIGVQVEQGGRITGNFITGGCLIGIAFYPDAGSATFNYAEDNFIDCNASNSEGFRLGSAYTGTGLGPKVQHNFVRVPSVILRDANPNDYPGKINILNNVFANALNGTSTVAIISMPGTTIGPNVCDTDLAAMDATTCAGTSAPFALP